MTTQPSVCPVCREPGGFHSQAIHGAHEVPRHLVWQAGEEPLWKVLQEQQLTQWQAVQDQAAEEPLSPFPYGRGHNITAQLTDEDEVVLNGLVVNRSRPINQTGLRVLEDTANLLKGLSEEGPP